MMRQLKGIAILAMAATVSGCSFMSPVQTPPDMGYVINQRSAPLKKSHRTHSVMMVLKPETSPAYNTTRIAFTDHPYQISYYSYSHWVEAPADMLLPLMVDALQQPHHYRAIVMPPFVGQYRYALRTLIKELRIDYTKPIATLNLSLQSQLLSGVTGNVIAAKEFNVAIPLQQRSPYGAVVAANRAAAIAIHKLAVWCIRHS